MARNGHETNAKDETATRARLVRSASRLFQRKGYHGTGLAEILVMAEAPKGSLYHHFPKGKADLAVAAAEWAAGAMEALIDRSFEETQDWRTGVEGLCARLAKLFERSGAESGCPVSGALLEGEIDPQRRRAAAQAFERWIDAAADHFERLGAPGDPRRRAEALLLALEGAWTLCRARGNGDTLRAAPALIGGDA